MKLTLVYCLAVADVCSQEQGVPHELVTHSSWSLVVHVDSTRAVLPLTEGAGDIFFGEWSIFFLSFV